MRPLKKPDAIFFDWDGTLVDSLPALLTFYNHVFDKFGHPRIDLEQAKKTIRRSAREVFPEIFGDKSDEAFAVYFDFVEKTHLNHVTPFANSFSFLQTLWDMKIPLGIVSNKRHKFLLREIDHLGWDKYLTSNIGAGEAAKDKPAPDSLLMAAQKMGLNPELHEIWYVGDTETDMMAAIAAGFQPIFIEHGLGTRANCEEHSLTPYFVNNFSDLIALVEKYR
jgi:phosphoglycolate phosphatase